MAKKPKTYIFEKTLIPTLKKAAGTKHDEEIYEKLREMADSVYKNNLSPEFPSGEVKTFPKTKRRIVTSWAGFGSETCNIRGLWTPESQAEYSDMKTAGRIKKDFREFVDEQFEKEVFETPIRSTKKLTTKKGK